MLGTVSMRHHRNLLIILLFI